MKIIAVTGMVVAVLTLTGCEDKPSPTAAAPAADAPRIASSYLPAAEPPKPDHAYALKEDGEYGYQRALSEDDVKAGRATAALLMVRFMGNKAGVRSVKIVDGNRVGVMSCSPPCEFVKARTYFAGQLVKTETIPVTDGSLIQAVMADAISGKLDVYGAKDSAQ
ncbi:hypothetical protein [Paraburkholderia terrae]|uniref:hypothetical protein n=1 Tax=Paraburkholderia terrae TaxID=311230 RepID=UPI00206A34B6|nr:hypothetical protein [Paraburkholderia terrae]BDC38926.1 hypothetical protein PTKU15_22230 [Paraburkholderia terrae]